MNREQALKELGAREDALTIAEMQYLDLEGYVIFQGVLSAEQVEAYRAALQLLVDEEGAEAGKEQHTEAGTDRVADLVNKGPLFDGCYTHPRVLSAAAHVLGPEMKLFAFSSRSALPGKGEQALHKDGYHQPEEPGEYHICNTIWLLDDFTAENGATRIVPGSHLRPGVPPEVAANAMATHPHEIQVTAPAGSVVVFNSHMLHGGTRNHTGHSRRAMFAAYCRSDQEQLTNQRKFLRPETAARLSTAAKVLLDVA